MKPFATQRVFSLQGDMKNLLIIIPAYNADKTLAGLVNEIKSVMLEQVGWCFEVLLVDDGSTDRTAQIAMTLGIRTITHPRNLGKGAAIRTAFEVARDLQIDALMTLDADLQHPPRSIVDFLQLYDQNKPDLIIGKRQLNRAMPAIRRFSNYLTSRMLSLKTGLELSDTQSGYRLIKPAALERVQLKTSHFETESELLIKFARQGADIRFVDIPTVYHDGGSHIKHFADTLRFMRMFLTT